MRSISEKMRVHDSDLRANNSLRNSDWSAMPRFAGLFRIACACAFSLFRLAELLLRLGDLARQCRAYATADSRM